jgi:UDP-N-acetylmuramyl pentapeptide phosphotransferase/UDP-N-acetylglucosamine-1-phosphate transferase
MPYLLFTIFCTLLFSFAFTYVCIPPIVKISEEKHLFDVPNSRKLNKNLVPTLGGISIFIGMTLSTILFLGNLNFPELRYILGALIMLFFIGLKDDILIIAPKKKLIIQVAAVAMLVGLGNFQITNLSNLFFMNNISDWLSVPLTFFVLLLVINSLNLIDGIDGLAAGISILVSGILGTWFALTGHYQYAVLSFALTGSLLAFLRFNLWGGKFKIFMGDTGSLVLGVVLGILVIKFLNFNMTAPSQLYLQHAPSFVLSLLIVPVTDTLRVFTLRILKGRSPFSADMNHIHHALIQSGMKHIQASVFLVLYTMAFIVMVLVTQDYLSSTTSFVTVLSLSFMATGMLAKRKEKIKTQKARQIRPAKQIFASGIPLEEDPFKYIASKKKVFQN